MSKNPTLDQVSSDVSLGKDGPFLKGDPTFDGGNGAVEIRNSDNSALAEAKGATPTTNESLATKLYVDSAIGVAPTLQSAYENGNTIVTSAVEGDFDVSGTEDVRLSSTQSLVFSGSANSSVSVTGANLTLTTLTSGDINVNSIDSFSVVGRANSEVTAIGADLTLRTLTSGDMNVSSAGSVIVTSATNVDVNSTGAVTLDANAASNFTVTGAPLSLATSTSGFISVSSADSFSIVGNAASDVTAVTSNLTLRTLTSGDVNVTSAGAIALDADASSSFTVDSTTGQDLTLSTTGLGGGSVLISSIAPATLQSTFGGVTVSGTDTVAVTSTSNSVNLTGNAASTFNVNGADLTLSTTTSGTLSLSSAGSWIGSAGGSTSGAGFNANLSAGSGTAGNTTGGRLDLDGGDGFGSGTGGLASLSGGTSGASTTAAGGGCSVSGGNAVSASGAGGQLTLRGGTTTGTGDGGDIVLIPGTSSGGGADGEVTIMGKLNVTGAIDPTALQLDPQAVDPGFTTSIWVSSADNQLYFTDSLGTAAQVSNTAAQIIETITVSTVGGVASVTFSGLDGDTDYRYFLTARFTPGALDVYEVRPNGSAFAANEGRGTFYEITGVEGSTAAFGSQQTSTNGWILHALLTGGDGGTSFVHGYANLHIQARREVGGVSAGGSTSARQCFGQGAIIDYNTGAPSYTRNRFTYTSGGWYQATPANITSLQIIGTSNIAQGSEFSLYRIQDV